MKNKYGLTWVFLSLLGVTSVSAMTLDENYTVNIMFNNQLMGSEPFKTVCLGQIAAGRLTKGQAELYLNSEY